MASKSTNFVVCLVILMTCPVSHQTTSCRNASVQAAGCVYSRPSIKLTRDDAGAYCSALGGIMMPVNKDFHHMENYKKWHYDDTDKNDIKQICELTWTPFRYDNLTGKVYYPNGDVLHDWVPAVPLNKSYDCLAALVGESSSIRLMPVACSEKLHFTCMTLVEQCSDKTCGRNQICEHKYSASCKATCKDIPTTSSPTSTPIPTPFSTTNSTPFPTRNSTPFSTTIITTETSTDYESSNSQTTKTSELPIWAILVIVGVAIVGTCIGLVICIKCRHQYNKNAQHAPIDSPEGL